jgi:hypothetical protein
MLALLSATVGVKVILVVAKSELVTCNTNLWLIEFKELLTSAELAFRFN